MDKDAVLKALREDEGLRLHLYYDTVGVPTIGYGTNITTIDKETAEWLLTHRLDLSVRDLLASYPVVAGLCEARQKVLVNMTYNMGIGRVSQFALMWRAIHAGDFDAAADEMLDSLWSHQTGPRAARLAAVMRTGQEVVTAPSQVATT